MVISKVIILFALSLYAKSVNGIVLCIKSCRNTDADAHKLFKMLELMLLTLNKNVCKL